jgi:8-oxo-dGTP diphosphatase
MFTYQYPRPALTVDCVIFAWDSETQQLKVLLIERLNEPFQDFWAFPGGFVDMDETIDTAAHRELEEETGLKNIFMEQLYTFGTVDRDPRGRVVSVAHLALAHLPDCKVVAASDAKKAEWFDIENLPKLAFDHDEIFKTALKRLQGKVRYEPIGFELLSEKFPLSQLRLLYEKILDTAIDKRNFRKKILKTGLLIPLEEFQTNVAHRAAQLFKFDKKKYQELQAKGFLFEI